MRILVDRFICQRLGCAPSRHAAHDQPACRATPRSRWEAHGIRLTVQEMNYAARRVAGLHSKEW